MEITYDPRTGPKLNPLKPKERICPVCGESRDEVDWAISVTETGKDCGHVEEVTTEVYEKGIIFVKTYEKCHYKCTSCGCEWTGDEHEFSQY